MRLNNQTVPKVCVRTLLWLASCASFVPFLLAAPQHNKPRVIDASVCSIIKNPAKFDNQLVRVHGYVETGFEWSLVVDDGCPEMNMWFVLGDQSGTSLVAWIDRSHPKRTPRMSIALKADSNYDKLVAELQRSARADSCLEQNTKPGEIPDCQHYRVSATFIGRIDGALSKTESGYGHLGMCRAQLVVAEVSEVQATVVSTKR